MNYIKTCGALKHRRGHYLSKLMAFVLALLCFIPTAGAANLEDSVIVPIISLYPPPISAHRAIQPLGARTASLEVVLSAASLSAQKNLVEQPYATKKLISPEQYSKVSTFTDEELYILSHLIAAEAGPNKTDELMVGSVFMNRVASPIFPDTMMGVLKQQTQYACWTNGSWASATPSESHIESAKQILSGEFSTPSNILFQTAAPQKSSGAYWFNVFLVNQNKPYSTHYYGCPRSESFSSTDRFGRPVPEGNAGVLKNIEYLLNGKQKINLASTLFIGDSLTVGLNNAVNLTSEYGSDIDAVVGRGVRATRDSLAEHDFSKYTDIVLTIGTNDATLPISIFHDNYEQLLLTITAAAPDANLYVCTLPPVDAVLYYGTDKKSPVRISNDDINEKNDVISFLQVEYKFEIVPLNSVVQSDGAIMRSYTSDGVHLSKAGYLAWFDLLINLTA